MDSHIPAAHRPRVWFEDGLCRIDFIPGVQVNRHIVEYVFQERLKLFRQTGTGIRHKLLVTSAGTAGIDYEASRMSISVRISETVIACAVVTESPAMRMIAAPFVLMFQPRYPIRLVPDQTAGRDWLREFPDS